MKPGEVKRGEVWWVRFGPGVGGEMQKQRPAVVVSNDSANKFLNRVQVIPLSSKVGKVRPSETLVTFKGKQGKALADQLTTVSKLRLISYAGTVTTSELERIETAIKVQLQL